MIGLVTLDFWRTLFADTQDSLRRAHVLRLEGVRETLAEAGRLYAPAEMAAADARAGEAFAAVWREHRDMAPDEQLRRFLDAIDPALPAALDAGTLGRVIRAYQEPALTYRPEITPGAAEAVHALHARGLLLGVISNTGRTPGSGAPPAPGGRGPPAALRRAGLLRRDGDAQAGARDLPSGARPRRGWTPPEPFTSATMR